MLKLPLKAPKRFPNEYRNNIYPWATCAPFVENSRGLLIHRPRQVSTYAMSHRIETHIGIGYWCGNNVSGDNNLTFLDTLPMGGKLLCARCEEAAVANGLPSADDLVGRHVHKGGLIAIQSCCKEGVSDA